MDSLKTLLDKQKYDLVIKLTESSSKPSDLFFRIAAFTCLGKYEEALFVIQDNAEILQKENLNSLISIHIELLCALERYDQAYASLDYYSNLPYENQLTEETLRKMPDLIASESKKKSAYKNKSEEEIIELLSSKNPDDLLFALDLIKKLDVLTYLKEISDVLVKAEKQTVRSFALMLLVQKEVDRELDFLSYKGLIKVNPKYIDPPFTGEVFNRLVREMDLSFKDTVLASNGVQLLSNLIIYIYPHALEGDEKEILGAIYLYSKALYKENIDIDQYCSDNNLNKVILMQYYYLIESAINDI